MQSVKVENVKSEINVTPLVDVVLVLLIIFMVITPMLTHGPPVQVPRAGNPPKKPEEKNQIMIVVNQNKELFIEKDKFTSDELFLSRMTEEYQRNKNATIVIKGDARVTYGDVKKAMMKVKQTGFEQVGLISQKQNQ
jgi:biopolymer transport protein TolR